ncbi:hypothetical protein BA895_22850 [Humibacillus sp. DSM 29435]|nr:hypothetical protein BA895_22850 [Humibacillus sp. DSM 29435]
MSLVWVVTMLAAVVAVIKASSDFTYLLFVLIGGFILSSAVLGPRAGASWTALGANRRDDPQATSRRCPQ